VSAERLKEAVAILREALSDHGDELHPWTCSSADNALEQSDGTYEIVESQEPCDCWISKAKEFLADLPLQGAGPISKGVSRLDGEECGTCVHSSTFHVANTGLCTKASCECMKFKPTGKPNQQVR
jgi:hypothetical protein